MKQQNTLKPLLKVGDEVTAAWWPPDDIEHDAAPTGWYRGKISSCKSVNPKSTNNCSYYGPVRYYNVNFDDGDVGRDIPEHFVFLTEEYELHTMNDDDDDENIVWKGVKTVTDRQSDDPWAKHVGWYVATLDNGQDHTFSLLSDALRAYDSFVVSTKGLNTKKEDLNIPSDWDKLFRDKAREEKYKMEVEDLKQRHSEEKEKWREKAKADADAAVRVAVVKEERKVREILHRTKKDVKEQCKTDVEKLKQQYEEENARRHEVETKAKKEMLKPRYQVGEEVYAAWWPEGNMRDERPLWYLGRVKSFKDQRCSSGKGAGEYGAVRLYKIRYTDDGSEQDNIPEHFVFHKDDYLLSTDNGPQHQWKGVKNIVHKDSDDAWASLIGYYVATIGGKEQFFSRLSDAIRAYDAAIVKVRGDKTKRSDLNIPKDWEWLFSPNAPPIPSVDELMNELRETRQKLTEQHKAFVQSLEEKYVAETEVAVKDAIAQERTRAQVMKRKLRKELTEFHESEMNKALKKFEEETVNIVDEALAKALKEHDRALEKQRVELEEHFQYEKDKEREFCIRTTNIILSWLCYLNFFVATVQFVKLETKEHQKNEMQVEFNKLKKEIEREIEQKLRSEYSLPPPPKRSKVSLSLVPRAAFSPRPTTVQKGKENVHGVDSLLTPPPTIEKTEEEPSEGENWV
jgi:hypothetical protein